MRFTPATLTSWSTEVANPGKELFTELVECHLENRYAQFGLTKGKTAVSLLLSVTVPREVGATSTTTTVP